MHRTLPKRNPCATPTTVDGLLRDRVDVIYTTAVVCIDIGAQERINGIACFQDVRAVDDITPITQRIRTDYKAPAAFVQCQ